jgi:hypothetical protein
MTTVDLMKLAYDLASFIPCGKALARGPVKAGGGAF